MSKRRAIPITFSLLKTLAESHPNAAYAAARWGAPISSWAAQVALALDTCKTQQDRDRLLVPALANLGVFVRSEREFSEGLAHWLDQCGTTPEGLDKVAHTLAQQSQQTAQPASAERISAFLQQAQQSDLARGLNERLNDADARTERHQPKVTERPELHHHADDRNDMRAAIKAAMATPRGYGSDGNTTAAEIVKDLKAQNRYAMDRLHDMQTEQAQGTDARLDRWRAESGYGLRDQLEQAFDAVELVGEHMDPLQDRSLVNASDVV